MNSSLDQIRRDQRSALAVCNKKKTKTHSWQEVGAEKTKIHRQRPGEGNAPGEVMMGLPRDTALPRGIVGLKEDEVKLWKTWV